MDVWAPPPMPVMQLTREQSIIVGMQRMNMRREVDDNMSVWRDGEYARVKLRNYLNFAAIKKARVKAFGKELASKLQTKVTKFFKSSNGRNESYNLKDGNKLKETNNLGAGPLPCGELFGFLRKVDCGVEDALGAKNSFMMPRIMNEFCRFFNCELGGRDGIQRRKGFVDVVSKWDVDGERILDTISYGLMGQVIAEKYNSIIRPSDSDMYAGVTTNEV